MSAGKLACTCLFVVAALANGAAAQDTGRATPGATGHPARLLDVPFVPQSEALCGGAAAAMVFRYWGAVDVHAEDFASLVDESAEGIRLKHLSRAITDRGWRPTPFSGAAADVQHHIARGRPVIALIEDRPGRLHYVVVVAWTGDRVVLHDPAHGPFRIVDRTTFQLAWAATNHTALLVLPPADTLVPAVARSQRSSDRCAEPLHEAVRLARGGDLSGAEALLRLIGEDCRGGAERELAGVRFLQQQWPEAERLAGEAVRHDPADMHAWQLLASSRFLQGDAAGALDAWNRRDEPRVDLTRIEGLDRMRHEVVADLVNIAPDDVLTDRQLARARRRLGELPAIDTARVSYTPRADGRALIDVAVLEKPVVPRRWPRLAGMAVHAAVAREVRVEAANVLGNGERWDASWRWWAGRPRLSVGLAAPRLGRATGLWRIEGSWEHQLFRHDLQPSANGRTEPLMDTERRRAAVSFGDWASGDFHWELSSGIDRWATRGSHASAGGAVEYRWLNDRVAVRAGGTMWRELGGITTTFGSSAISGAWRSEATQGGTWTATAGLHGVSARAPFDLWPATDTGQVRPLLLRAHPLLDRGAIRASELSRVLAHATIERQQPLATRLPGRIWWAAFIDLAKRGSSADGSSLGRTLVDVGAGLRINVPGTPHVVRLDVARGVRDGRTAFSAGWQIPWPGWRLR